MGTSPRTNRWESAYHELFDRHERKCAELREKNAQLNEMTKQLETYSHLDSDSLWNQIQSLDDEIAVLDFDLGTVHRQAGRASVIFLSILGLALLYGIPMAFIDPWMNILLGFPATLMFFCGMRWDNRHSLARDKERERLRLGTKRQRLLERATQQ